MTSIHHEVVKRKGVKRIHSWGLPVSERPPTLETGEEISPQSAADVARRCIVIICLLLGSSGCVSDKNSTFAKPVENPATGRYADSEEDRENHKKMVEWAIQNEAKDWKQGKRGGEGGGLTWESFWADRFKAYDLYDDNPSWSKQYVRERRRQLGLPPLKI